MISAGLDNASINDGDAINEYTFYYKMDQEVPGIFGQIDGLGSHSYPNPAFAQPPWVHTSKSITSFLYEKYLADRLGSKTLPVFITETGWSQEVVNQPTIATYFQDALSSTWNDPDIVAITPFLLNAGSGPFASFSLLNTDGSENAIFQAIKNTPKQKGQPTVMPSILIANSIVANIPLETFPVAQITRVPNKPSLHEFKTFFKWLLKIE